MIKQTSTFLPELLREAEAGRLLPASFQRPYVWRKPDVEAFWSSIMRGFPIGSFLTWTPPADLDLSGLGRQRLGPVTAASDRFPTLVLDGQNRLASFAWSLLDEAGETPDADWADRFEASLGGVAPLSPAERETWISGEFLAVDPAERSVRFRPRAEAAERLLVPASVVARSTKLMPFMRAWDKTRGEVPDDQLTWIADVAARRILECRVTVTNLDRLSPEEALDAFRHIAKTGVPMSDEDFEAALAFAFPSDAPKP